MNFVMCLYYQVGDTSGVLQREYCKRIFKIFKSKTRSQKKHKNNHKQNSEYIANNSILGIIKKS